MALQDKILAGGGPSLRGEGAPEHSLCRIPKVECSASPPPRFPNSVDRRSAQRAWRLPGISAPLLGRAADLRGDSARHVRGRAARVRLHATVPLRSPGLPQCSAPLPAAAVHAFPFAACDGTRRLPFPGISIPPSLESISFPPATSFRPFLRFFLPMQQRGGGKSRRWWIHAGKRDFARTGAETPRAFAGPPQAAAQKKYFPCPGAFEVRNPESPALHEDAQAPLRLAGRGGGGRRAGSACRPAAISTPVPFGAAMPHGGLPPLPPPPAPPLPALRRFWHSTGR